MRYLWLNKQFGKNLIVFFTGWSFDEKPFSFLEFEDCDVLFLYDYSNLNIVNALEFFNKYDNKYLICWSMGVFIAYELRKYFTNFDKKIAVNGTPYPIDDNFGIPLKPFLLTLRQAKIGLEGKFYKNLFMNIDEYKKYCVNPIIRTIDNRVNELHAIYDIAKKADRTYSKFYDLALVSSYDKIFPCKNQINFWNLQNVSYKILESGHFPYYNYHCWKDLLCT